MNTANSSSNISFFSFFLATLLCIGSLSCSKESKGQPEETKPLNTNKESPILGHGSADISISLTNAPSGIVYLVGTYADQLVKVDTAHISSEGNVRFQRNPAYPQGHYYVTFNNNANFQLILGEDQTMEVTVDIHDVVPSFSSDNLENKLLYETMKKEAALQPEFNKISQDLKAHENGSPAYNEARTKHLALTNKRRAILEDVFAKHPTSMFVAFKQSGQNPEIRMDIPEENRVAQYRKDFWDSVDFSDTRLIRTPVIKNKLKRYMTELTPQHQDSIVQSATWLIDKVVDYPEYFKYFVNWVPLYYEPTKTSLMDPEKVYTTIVQRYLTFDRAFWADSTLVIGLQKRAAEMAGSLLGLIGPNVTANDLNGDLQSLHDLEEDYLVVYLYSPDCEHCKEETPKLIEWYHRSKPFSANVYSIAVKTNTNDWKEYSSANNIPWVNVYDPSNRAIYGKYFVDITPEMYVLNKDRKIIAKNIKTHQLDQVINQDRG